MTTFTMLEENVDTRPDTGGVHGVSLLFGADGSNKTAVSTTNPLPADAHQWGGTALSAAAAPADSTSAPTNANVNSFGLRYNGSNFEMERSNLESTALASAARTATTTSANITNNNGRGLQIFLKVTSGSSLSLQPVVLGINTATGAAYQLHAAPTAVTGTGNVGYQLYPGAAQAAGGDLGALWQVALPRTFAIRVIHNNANSATYEVEVDVLN